jgi:hypothetical protein
VALARRRVAFNVVLCATVKAHDDYGQGQVMIAKRTVAACAVVATAALVSSGVQATTLSFSSADQTFAQNGPGGLWSAALMIDGCSASCLPYPSGWAVYNFSTGQAEAATALLTLTTPVAAGPQNWTVTLYQNLSSPPQHLLGDFSLGYSTAASPTLSSSETLFTITGASSLNGTTFTPLGPSELLAGGPTPNTDVYTISLTEDSLLPVTGLFLNVFNNALLPFDGPGRQPTNGNFVVSELTASVTPLPAALPLFAGGLGVIGLFCRRRKQKNTSAIAA